MSWPGWGDILPTVTLVSTIAGLLWVVVRLVVVPVVDRAVSEVEKRAAETTRVAVDGLYERLKANDFRHVDEGFSALGARMDRMDRRMDRMDGRIEGVRKDVRARFREARQDRREMEGRLMAAIQGQGETA